MFRPHSPQLRHDDERTEQFDSCSILIKKFQSQIVSCAIEFVDLKTTLLGNNAKTNLARE